MGLSIMRRIVGDAGNLQRLYFAVRVAEEILDDEKRQWKRFIELVSQGQSSSKGLSLGPSKIGRSAEPHLSLAKELDLLEMPPGRLGSGSNNFGRWRVTVHAGRPFLRLWESGHKPPAYFLLAQLMKSDRTFLLPFIRGLLQRGFSKADEVAAGVWEELWRRYPAEMATAEPLFPRTLYRNDGTLKRTAKHHADARIRFLIKPEGLNLSEVQLQRIIMNFSEFEAKPLPSDLYFRIGQAVTGTMPDSLNRKEAVKMIEEAHSVLQRSGISSTQALFHYINENSLPEMALDWNNFQHLLRSEGSYSLYPGLLQGDTLVSIKVR